MFTYSVSVLSPMELLFSKLHELLRYLLLFLAHGGLKRAA